MPIHKGIRCSIQANGYMLQEYWDGGDEAAESSVTQTAYVEAQDSAHFLVSCEILPGYSFNITNRVSFRVYLDGEYMCRRSVSATDKRKNIKLEGSYGIDELGNEYIYPFQFAAVSLVEDHDSEVRIDPLSLVSIGEISVYAIRTQWVRKSSRKLPRAYSAPQKATFETVNEKALKGRDLTHNTKLGPRKDLGRGSSSVETKEYDSIEKPFLHFRFLYRSKGALQNIGLIPRTPTPPAFILSRHAKGMTMKKEVAQRYAQLEPHNNKTQTKREMKEESGNNLNSKWQKLLRTAGEIETVDLTGED